MNNRIQIFQSGRRHSGLAERQGIFNNLLISCTWIRANNATLCYCNWVEIQGLDFQILTKRLYISVILNDVLKYPSSEWLQFVNWTLQSFSLSLSLFFFFFAFLESIVQKRFAFICSHCQSNIIYYNLSS